jgi:hypothetical protein
VSIQLALPDTTCDNCGQFADRAVLFWDSGQRVPAGRLGKSGVRQQSEVRSAGVEFLGMSRLALEAIRTFPVEVPRRFDALGTGMLKCADSGFALAA